MRYARILMFLAAAGAIQAQTSVNWDSSGNGMLKGTYYFRQVYYVIGDQYSDLSEAVTIYGGITFDGNGNYTIAAANGAQYIDYSYYYSQVLGGGSFTASGTYSISSSGYGFLSSPYVSGDAIYGMVGANGVFVGSSTDTQSGYNDMLVAAPQTTPAPSASGFAGTWILSDFDLSSGYSSSALNSVISITPDASGNLNVKSITGYEGGSTGLISQTASGVKYVFSNGAAVATFPSSGALVIGQKYFYFSPDGNFLFGGSPNTSATPFDFVVGVKTTSTPTFSGLYYQVGLDEVGGSLDSYFGSFDVLGTSGTQTYLGHERLNNLGGVGNASSVGGGVSDFTYEAGLTLSGGVYADSYARYIVGDGGKVEITSGVGQYLGLSVAVQAPTVTGSGVFLNPQGILNAASYAPFTASIAPGELLTMFGSNLSTKTAAVVGGSTAPTSLGGVSVNIGGYQAPIFSVSPSQVSVIVPYEVTAGSIVQIQLTNGTGSSNVVTQYVGATAPGVFTQCACGTSYGAIAHLGIGNSHAAAGSLVSDANPAEAGETVAIALTGLGTVTPAIADGGLGPSSAPLSQTDNTIYVGIGGSVTALTNDFAGLAPGFSGLYQLNVTLPTTGLTAGPNALVVSGPDSFMQYLLIPVSTSTGEAAVPNVRTEAAAPVSGRVPPKIPHTPGKASPGLRAKVAK